MKILTSLINWTNKHPVVSSIAALIAVLTAALAAHFEPLFYPCLAILVLIAISLIVLVLHRN